MTRFRLVAAGGAVALVVVLALVISGGGGKDTTLVSGSALADAADATGRVPGASLSMEQTITAEGLPAPMHAHLRGVQNTRQKAIAFGGTFEGFPKGAPGQDSEGKIPVEAIGILPHMYMKSPLFSAKLPAGKSWIGIDLAKAGRQSGIGDPTQFASSDPGESVQALRAVSSRVERVGTEEVRGVPTTHYRATVDLRRLPSAVPRAKRAAARRYAAKVSQLTGTDSYPTEVWVDRRHLVRRLREIVSMKVQGTPIKYDVTIEMFDFGSKHRIKPPPAAQTFDATNLAATRTRKTVSSSGP